MCLGMQRYTYVKGNTLIPLSVPLQCTFVCTSLQFKILADGWLMEGRMGTDGGLNCYWVCVCIPMTHPLFM